MKPKWLQPQSAFDTGTAILRLEDPLLARPPSLLPHACVRVLLCAVKWAELLATLLYLQIMTHGLTASHCHVTWRSRNIFRERPKRQSSWTSKNN